MKYEDVYAYTGQIGRYQCRVFVCVGFLFMFLCDAITFIFIGAAMPHWCRVPELANYSFDRQKYIAVPRNGDGDDETDSYSSCEMFAFNYSTYSDDELRGWNRSIMIGNATETVRCHEWIYDQTTFTSTIVSKFNLVCGADFLSQLAITILLSGSVIGTLTSGVLSDRIGRKKSMLIYLCCRIVGFTVLLSAPSYSVFITGCLVMGVGSTACYTTAFVLAMEFVGVKYRTLVACGIHCMWSVGFMLQAPLSYALRDYVTYGMVTYIPCIAFLSYIFFVPESPRWLVVKKKYKEANALFEKICDVNGTRLPADFDTQNIENVAVVGNAKHCNSILETPQMRLRTLVTTTCWFACHVLYFGQTLNTGSLSGSIHVNTFISGALEIPAKILCYFIIGWKVTGRRLTMSGSLLLGGVFNLICIPMILLNYSTSITVLSLIAKTFATISYVTAFLYTSELFPTEVRNIGVGVASTCGRIGTTIAPYLGAPLAAVWSPLPALLFGLCGILAALVSLLLPETLGVPLFDTVEQVELFAKKRLDADDDDFDEPNCESLIDSNAVSPDGPSKAKRVRLCSYFILKDRLQIAG